MEKMLTKLSSSIQKIEEVSREEIKTAEDYMLVCSSLMAVTRNMYLEGLGPMDTVQMFEAVADSIIATDEILKQFKDYPKATIH